MITLFYIILFALGLVVGSYLNSWVWRYRSGILSLPKRSVCVHCRAILKWFHNVPVVSFLVLKGKCGFCAKRIPSTYVWVELAGGFLMLIIGWHASVMGLTTYAIFRNVFFALLLLVVFVYDAKYMEIPTGVVRAGFVVALIVNFFVFRFSVLNLVTGSLVGGGFFLAQYTVSKGRWVGGGDVRLGFMMGALLGWPLIIWAIGFSYVLGALVSVPLLLLKKKKMDSAIPFGTFLVVGTIAVLLYGAQLSQWYFMQLR